MTKIDAHIHFVGGHPDAVGLLEELDLKMLNICVAQQSRSWRETEAAPYRSLAQQYPDRFAWCASFDLPGPDDFDGTEYSERVIAGLEQDFANDAVACKVWKNIGMELQRPNGEFVFVDDPIFEPIIEYLTRIGKPLLFHIGEPRACWQPLSSDLTAPHQSYYRRFPQWHMYGRTDHPSHEELVASWEKMVARHPNQRFIGAHLGGLEYDVTEVARRFDRYPNLAMDMSARLSDLSYQDSETVRQLFLTYPDRILFGTDLVRRTSFSGMTDEERKELYDGARFEYDAHALYFESEGPIHVRNRDTEGLALPPQVLQKFYTDNARSWYPGL